MNLLGSAVYRPVAGKVLACATWGGPTMSEPANQDRAGARLEEFQRNPRKALWTLSLPIMVGMSIYTAYMIADMVFVGMLGPDALIAVSFTMPLLFLAMGSTFGLGSAVTAMIAQAIGAKDQRRASRWPRGLSSESSCDRSRVVPGDRLSLRDARRPPASAAIPR